MFSICAVCEKLYLSDDGSTPAGEGILSLTLKPGNSRSLTQGSLGTGSRLVVRNEDDGAVGEFFVGVR